MLLAMAMMVLLHVRSLSSCPLQPSCLQSVGKLWQVSKKATNIVPPSGQPLWHNRLWPLGIVTLWAINHVGVDKL